MNEDYLWDKSGEPDPEIQRLEQILGTLRYQERPLELPEQILTTHKPNRFYLWAIAATVVLGILAASLWLKSRDSHTLKNEIAVAPAKVTTAAPKESPAEPVNGSKDVREELQADKTRPEKKLLLAKARIPVKPVMSAKEREEALAAKEQLLLALRVASEKLNEVQRRTAGPTQIKNQHKVG